MVLKSDVKKRRGTYRLDSDCPTINALREREKEWKELRALDKFEPNGHMNEWSLALLELLLEPKIYLKSPVSPSIDVMTP